MKENAIIIRQLDVIKTYVDFSDFDNINEAINANRISTIHTVKTQELSSKLGIHLMGFVDSEGSDINNKKACTISGYEYLGSFMLLCKTDDKYNPLPFEEDELECVYHYLTTGEIKSKSSFNKDELGEFIEKYGINPVIPNLPVKPEITFFENYPKVVLLAYDYGPDTGADLGRIGGELFKFSDILVQKFYKEDDALVSEDETYCVKSKTDMASSHFYLLIQVLQGRRDQPVIGDTDAFIDAVYGSSEEEAEEIPDEPEDIEKESSLGGEYELDWMLNYIIRVEVEAEWPNLQNTSCKYTYAYPLLQYKVEEEEQTYFPYFKGLITLVDFDYFGDTADIKLKLGEKYQKVHLELDESQTINFDYTPNAASSHRVGKITLTLEKYDIDSVEVEGKIFIDEFLLNEANGPTKKAVVVSKQNIVLRNLSNTDDSTNDCIAEGDLTGSRYFPWLISDDGEFILLSANFDDYDDPDIKRHIYIPIRRGERIINYDRFMSNEDYPANVKVVIEFID